MSWVQPRGITFWRAVGVELFGRSAHASRTWRKTCPRARAHSIGETMFAAEQLEQRVRHWWKRARPGVFGCALFAWVLLGTRA